MKSSNIEVMNSFSIRNIPNLDVCVLAALELLAKSKIPKLNLPYKHPLVVGSGNAAATGRIIFNNCDVVFADESSFLSKLKSIKSIDGIVLISASGGKHAPIIAKAAKRFKKHLTLITNNSGAKASQFLDKKHPYDLYLFPKNREPYTYNTSTYMGPIFGFTKEDPAKVHKFLTSKISKLKLPNFKRYDKFFLVVPEEFEGIIRLLNVKFIELFGRRLAHDVETFEYVKHATTVVPSPNELFITFGEKKVWFTDKNFHVPLPKDANYGAMMAIAYFIIGKIQAAHTPYFKQNINKYTRDISKVFGSKISPIVD